MWKCCEWWCENGDAWMVTCEWWRVNGDMWMVTCKWWRMNDDVWMKTCCTCMKVVLCYLSSKDRQSIFIIYIWNSYLLKINYETFELFVFFVSQIHHISRRNVEREPQMWYTVGKTLVWNMTNFIEVHDDSLRWLLSAYVLKK